MLAWTGQSPITQGDRGRVGPGAARVSLDAGRGGTPWVGSCARVRGCRTGWPQPRRPTCCSTRTTRWTGGSGATRRSPRRGGGTCRCCSSIGYAACHWCHVMAHESFEDPATAAVMNEGFVNVKVDREERPDVDAVYMAATQALTGQGGWPMTVFLTPQGRPFYAGTYFPPAPRHGMPVVPAGAARRSARPGASGATRSRRAGDRIAAALAGARRRRRPAPPDDGRARGGGRGAGPRTRTASTAASAARRSSRRRWTWSSCCGTRRGAGSSAGDGATSPLEGGPARSRWASPSGRCAPWPAAGCTTSSRAASRGTPSTPAWVVPHFEKMLYDNALLARVYLHWWRLTGEPTGRRVALETCDWMLADAAAPPQGGLASSLDADTPVRDADGRVHGVEGLTYVWTPGAAARVARRRRTAPGPAELLRRHPAGHVRARHARPCSSTRDVWADPDAGAALGAGPRPAARRRGPRRPAAGPRRQGGGRLERPGDRRARRDRRAARPARPGRGRGAGRRPAARRPPGAEPGLATGAARVRLRRVSRDGVVGAPAGVLEDYARRGRGPARPARRDRRGGVARRSPAALLDTVLDHVRRRATRRLPRHPRRRHRRRARRGAPPAGPDRQRLPRPAGPRRPGAAVLRGADRVAAGTGTRPRPGSRVGRCRRARGRRGRSAGRWRWRRRSLDGPREVAVVGPDGDPRPRRAARRRARRRRPRRWWSASARRTPTASRCWRTGRWWAAPRRPTCAGGSSARRRSTDAAALAAQVGADRAGRAAA